MGDTAKNGLYPSTMSAELKRNLARLQSKLNVKDPEIQWKSVPSLVIAFHVGIAQIFENFKFKAERFISAQGGRDKKDLEKILTGVPVKINGDTNENLRMILA